MGLAFFSSSSGQFISTIVEGQQRASVQRTILGGLWYAVIPLVQIVVYYFLIVIIFGRGGVFTPSRS